MCQCIYDTLVLIESDRKMRDLYWRWTGRNGGRDFVNDMIFSDEYTPGIKLDSSHDRLHPTVTTEKIVPENLDDLAGRVAALAAWPQWLIDDAVAWLDALRGLSWVVLLLLLSASAFAADDDEVRDTVVLKEGRTMEVFVDSVLPFWSALMKRAERVKSAKLNGFWAQAAEATE